MSQNAKQFRKASGVLVEKASFCRVTVQRFPGGFLTLK
jgi:hypothetical protein